MGNIGTKEQKDIVPTKHNVIHNNNDSTILPCRDVGIYKDDPAKRQAPKY